jgi:hypothetical protein
MAQQTEIISEIEALAVHCPPRMMTTEARALWMRDWCSDLSSFPVSAIRAAFTAWRNGDNPRFPTAGQVLPMVRANTPRKAGPTIKAPDPWAPISDAEFELLSLSEKARHLLILAAEARRKAGPMWKNPEGGLSMTRPVAGHVHPDDVSDEWREWSARATNLEAEAERLKRIIRKEPARLSA